MKDEIVDEVRAARDAYAAKFDFDVRRIVQDLRRREAESNREYITLPSKAPPQVLPVTKAGQVASTSLGL